MRQCISHHVCQCIQARLDRIEAVWQMYKHATSDRIIRDLWQTIRREE
ncbi:MAG TPA: hypothetical protein VI727_08140 [Candidatus Brocadiaceae bacterium]|nr:hypothetical protein [Candidatus Brocadiaceae bacterium]